MKDDDPLLAALRELPVHTPEADGQRLARATYLRSFERETWHDGLFGSVSRAAMPVFLAAIVGLYMTWAIATATALVH